MNNFSILVTRPKDDLTTNYLFSWASLVIKEVIKKGGQVFDLREKRANRKEFCSVIKKTNPKLIFLNGHGNKNAITGQGQEILIQSNDNEDITKDSVVYALSCSAASVLGSRCIQKGTKSFIGYKNDFIFLTEQSFITRPLDDQTAALFFEPSNLVINSLIKGRTVFESYNRSQKEFKRNIKKLLTSESLQKDQSSVRFLLWDMEHQVCLGDTATRV
ncbi:MAG: hypothetical protein UR98_C0022G0010 [Parcubacteria group bacterium GW2011_GWA1_36_12]|nr:MAG: hypothetical protein UR98_C0022G0010 [Parcubacteria group bacterium GW2011_GWA1_36_12]